MQNAATATTATTTWRLLDGAAPQFVSLTGRALRFTLELEVSETDYAVVLVEVVVESWAGTPCCEVRSVDVAYAIDVAGSEAWVRENIETLVEDVRFS